MTRRRSNKAPWGATAGLTARGGTDPSGLMWQVVTRAGPPRFSRAELTGSGAIILHHLDEPDLWVSGDSGPDRRYFSLSPGRERFEIVADPHLHALGVAAASVQELFLAQAYSAWRLRGAK